MLLDAVEAKYAILAVKGFFHIARSCLVHWLVGGRRNGYSKEGRAAAARPLEIISFKGGVGTRLPLFFFFPPITPFSKFHMEPLDEETSEVILKRIKWRHGIRPSGELADQPSFVLRAMPDIVLVSPDQSRSFLVTESTWSDNLVNSCVLWTLHDDATIDAAAECHAIFQRRQPVNQRTLHYLHFETFAWFPINSILRPTKKFQKALDEALQQWPETPQLAWQQLCQVWQEFGYLWPQKIVLGMKRRRRTKKLL